MPLPERRFVTIGERTEIIMPVKPLVHIEDRSFIYNYERGLFEKYK